MVKVPKEVAKEIRNGLKNDYGYNRNQVSVCVFDSTVQVEVKDPDVNCQEVKDYAYQFREVDIDETTGEVLLGNNIYIFFKNIAINQQYLKSVKKTINIMDENPKTKGFPITNDIMLNFYIDDGVREYSIATPNTKTRFKKYISAEKIALEITTLK